MRTITPSSCLFWTFRMSVRDKAEGCSYRSSTRRESPIHALVRNINENQLSLPFSPLFYHLYPFFPFFSPYYFLSKQCLFCSSRPFTLEYYILDYVIFLMLYFLLFNNCSKDHIQFGASIWCYILTSYFYLFFDIPYNHILFCIISLLLFTTVPAVFESFSTHFYVTGLRAWNHVLVLLTLQPEWMDDPC